MYKDGMANVNYFFIFESTFQFGYDLSNLGKKSIVTFFLKYPKLKYRSFEEWEFKTTAHLDKQF